MKERKKSDLPKLLGISEKLAETASEYWSAYRDDLRERDDERLNPCIYSFSGAAYQGLQARSLSESSMQYLQDNLRIVDPLYGLLRPLDILQPYRLEMACRQVFPNDRKLKLADFWTPDVTESLSEELQGRSDPVLLNLASDEYSAAVDPLTLPEIAKFIKVVFHQEGRTIAVHAKRARGLMAKYLAENHVNTLEGVREFSTEGYSFVPDKSNECTLVFDREKPDTTASKEVSSSSTTNRKRKRK